MQKKIEEDQIKQEQDFQLLLKLGFEESLAREAISKHPGDPQSAINYVLNIRK